MRSKKQCRGGGPGYAREIVAPTDEEALGFVECAMREYNYYIKRCEGHCDPPIKPETFIDYLNTWTVVTDSSGSSLKTPVPFFRPYLTMALFSEHAIPIMESWLQDAHERFRHFFVFLRPSFNPYSEDLKDFSRSMEIAGYMMPAVGPVLTNFKLLDDARAEGPKDRVLFARICIFLIENKLMVLTPQPFRDALRSYLMSKNPEMLKGQLLMNEAMQQY